MLRRLMDAVVLSLVSLPLSFAITRVRFPNAQKRIGNARLVPKSAILKLSNRMRLTMQKRLRAFLFQIVNGQ